MHGRHTFPKSERLRYGHQFRHIYDCGRKVAAGLAVLYILEEPGRAVGIVTGRRLGGAVTRNRARRLLREVYRLNKQKLKPNLQMVIVARAAIRGKRFQEVEADMLKLFQTAGALIES